MPDITLVPATDVDQTASLQSQVDAIGDGTVGSPTTINLPDGSYRIDGGLALNFRNHLRVTCPTGVFTMYTDKHGTELTPPLTSRIHCGIGGSTDVVVSFVRVEGPHDLLHPDTPLYAWHIEAWESDHAFAIRSGSVDCGFEDCTFTQVGGDGLYVGFQNEGIPNVDCFARRITGTYCGRQCVALTHVVGFEGSDITIEWGGQTGLDVEPNSPNDKVWDVTLTRCDFNSKHTPYAITGASNGPLPQRKNISLIDCTTLGCGSSHTAVQASRGPSDGLLLIDGLTDLRQPTIYGLNLSGAWENVTVQNCTVTTSNNAATSYAVRANCTGELRIIDNVFNGRPGTEGFDELSQFVVSTPTTFVHGGNVWAMGTQNDGAVEPDPGPTEPPVVPSQDSAFQETVVQTTAFQAPRTALQTDTFQADAFQAHPVPAFQWFVQTDAFQLDDPFQVKNLVATPVSQTQVDLTWDPTPALADGYDIERDGLIIAAFHPTNSYSDTGLTQETTYTYRVRAVELV